jgi:hypothetical protein
LVPQLGDCFDRAAREGAAGPIAPPQSLSAAPQPPTANRPRLTLFNYVTEPDRGRRGHPGESPPTETPSDRTHPVQGQAAYHRARYHQPPPGPTASQRCQPPAPNLVTRCNRVRCHQPADPRPVPNRPKPRLIGPERIYPGPTTRPNDPHRPKPKQPQVRTTSPTTPALVAQAVAVGNRNLSCEP